MLVERLDGFLFSGGGDMDPAFYGEPVAGSRGIDRQRDELELVLVQRVVQARKPFLAICRGHQVVNVALGGSLYQDLASDMPGAIRHDYFQSAGYARDLRPHEVQLEPDSRVAQILGGTRFPVNSLHHQGIRRLAEGLVPVGYAPDGLVEAFEMPDYPFAIGVQWHPEALAPTDPTMQRLFDALVQAARDGRRGSL